jgi:hypothetical protein
MAVSFNEILVLQINKDECAFSGKIAFLEPVGEPWKVNTIYATISVAVFCLYGTCIFSRINIIF